MGCCDSKERKGQQDPKFYDSNTFDEDSTKIIEQDDFKMTIIKKSLQREEKDKSAVKQISKQPNQNNNNPAQNIIDNNKSKSGQRLYDITQNILQNEANQPKINNNNNINQEIPIIVVDQNEKSLQQSQQQNEQDQEERKSEYSQYYTPPNEPSEIPHSFQEDSFMLDLQLSNHQKPYYEYDPNNRRTEIRPNFEEQSDQMMRGGSVPIYLKNSKAFIIPCNGNNFDMMSFLEETKQAIETLQKNKDKNIADRLKQKQSSNEGSDEQNDNYNYDDEDGFSSPKNLFDADFDKEINQPFKKQQVEEQQNQQILNKIENFYEFDDLQNQIVNSNQIKETEPHLRWDYIDIQEELTENEQKTFQQLKEIFLQEMDYPYKQEISDNYLVRFLRAKRFDLKHARSFLEKNLKWRITEKIDQIFEFKFDESEEIKLHYPHGLHYTDREGRPLYIERLGQLNYTKLFQATSQDRLVKYYIQFYEKMIKHIFQLCTQIRGERVDKMVVILDCKDISLRLDQITSFLQTAVNITKDNYPEILHKMYIVNTGMMFNIAWKAVSVLLGDKTKKKISILGTKYIHEVEKDIPLENLPKFLGGKCKCEIDNCMNNNCGP